MALTQREKYLVQVAIAATKQEMLQVFEMSLDKMLEYSNKYEGAREDDYYKPSRHVKQLQYTLEEEVSSFWMRLDTSDHFDFRSDVEACIRGTTPL